jgi:hypothetical protein
MILHRKDIDKIKEILDKFPNVEVFEIEQENSSGIGSYTHMTFTQEVNGQKGSFNIEIAGVEDW